jgi:hypothetical protein
MAVMLAVLVALQPSEPPPDASPAPEHAAAVLTATGHQMLAMADNAIAADREDIAVKILSVLLRDAERSIRNEARFRLAMLASRRKDWTEAGTQLRAILDEEPDAQRVRLELARVQAEMGDLEASRRTLREVQAGGLPPDVARLVERFSAALRERKPFGASFQIAIAPDSNVNRATRSETLGTVLGNFDLDEAARRTSGIGLAVGSEAYFRHPFAASTSLVVRAGFSGNFYREAHFDDLTAVVSAGPELPLGGGRANLLAGVQRRWFGGDRYSDGIDASFTWQRTVGRRAQLRAGLGAARINYRLNDQQDGTTLSGFAGVERALGSRSGLSLSLGVTRQIARGPAYSSTGGQLTTSAWREFGRTTFLVTTTYQHLEADERLAIYPQRRKEDFLRFSVGAILRSLNWKGWAPQVKVIWERNWSPIEIYSYERWRSEFGIVRAF